MNKLIITLTSLFIIMSFSTIASAAGVFTSASAGAAITFTTSGAGPTLVFTPSPSTLISSITSATAFGITAASAKTDTTNGIEYGAVSTSNAMFQMQQKTKNAVQVAALILPTGFKDKSGTAAPTE